MSKLNFLGLPCLVFWSAGAMSAAGAFFVWTVLLPSILYIFQMNFIRSFPAIWTDGFFLARLDVDVYIVIQAVEALIFHISGVPYSHGNKAFDAGGVLIVRYGAGAYYMFGAYGCVCFYFFCVAQA